MIPVTPQALKELPNMLKRTSAHTQHQDTLGVPKHPGNFSFQSFYQLQRSTHTPCETSAMKPPKQHLGSPQEVSSPFARGFIQLAGEPPDGGPSNQHSGTAIACPAALNSCTHSTTIPDVLPFASFCKQTFSAACFAGRCYFIPMPSSTCPCIAHLLYAAT